MANPDLNWLDAPPNLMMGVGSVFIGQWFAWFVESEDGNPSLAFLIRTGDGVYKIEDAEWQLAGAFSTFVAAIIAGVVLGINL